jgi:transposase
VAIANKHARQLWTMPAHEQTYDADAWLKHPMMQRSAGKQTITVAAVA